MTPTWLVADVETTGLDPTVDKIVEIAWVEMDEDLGFVPDSEFSSLINPERSVSCVAAGVNGIRDSVIEAENPPTIDEITFPSGEVILICHNLKFDYEFLKPYMNIVDGMCTYVLSRRLLPDAPEHKLQTLSCYCDLPYQLAHRAIGDARTTGLLLEYLCEGCEYSLEQMLEYYHSRFLFTRMPFGKHKGEMMKDVPRSYLGWLSQQDLDVDTRATVDYWLRRK